jgi:hypothetical protein
MKKRQFLVLGLLALFLVLITGLTGCDSDPSYKTTWTFNNQSRYTIQVDAKAGYDVSPRSFSLRPGATQKMGSNTITYMEFTWRIADVGWTGNGVRVVNSSPTFTPIESSRLPKCSPSIASGQLKVVSKPGLYWLLVK